MSRMIRKSEDLPGFLHVMPPRTEVYLILRIKKGHPGSMKVGPGFFYARALDKQFFKEKLNETGTGTFEDDSSINQGLGWLPGSHAENHDVF